MNGTAGRAVVAAPATIANLGPGFDVFGLCMDGPEDIVSVEFGPGSGSVRVSCRSPLPLPSDPERNAASRAAMALLRAAGADLAHMDVSVSVEKGIRPGSGLGSSGASAIGGAYAAALALSKENSATPNKRSNILRAAAEGEAAASGAPHLDNVAPCLLGGFTIVAPHLEELALRIEPPKMTVAVALPDVVVETRAARAVLPPEVGRAAAVENLSLAASLVHAVETGDLVTLGKCLGDALAVPYRKRLIPGYDLVREAAIAAGALGFSISGSGPAVFAVCDGSARRVAAAMADTFRGAGTGCTTWTASPGRGARVLEVAERSR